MLAMVLLSVTAGVCFALGLWQLERAAERDALQQVIEHGRLQSPLTLSAYSAATDLLPWRPAIAQGRWAPEYTVLLQNRNLDGRPGYWVATPLVLALPAPPSNRHDAVSAGSAEADAIGHVDGNLDFLGRGPVAGDTAVLVLRGWLPRDMQGGGIAPAIPEEPGMVEVGGELHSHVPRIFELWEWAGGESSHLPDTLPQAGGDIPQVQNLDLKAYARATGLNLLPVVLAQTSASSAPSSSLGSGAVQADAQRPQAPSALRREWPGPSLDSDQNRGYALQWFSFSAIALIAILFVARNMLRRARHQEPSKEAP